MTARDTPNFIGNRIALFEAVQILRAVDRGDVTIEETDAITGPAIGRPKSATFRTMDIAGVDVIAHVANNLRERLSDDDERAHFELPDFVGQMIARGMTGAKAGRGFYEKRGEDILTLDPRTLEYRPRQNVRLPALDAAKSTESAPDRIRTLIKGQDKVGAFLRSTLMPTLEYAVRIAPEVAHSPDDVDRAMRWGFGWDVGPLALVDALNGPPAPVARPASQLSGAPVLSRNAGANLVDLGDGVLCVEFHSKMNAIGGDTIQMLHAGIKEASEKGRCARHRQRCGEFLGRRQPDAAPARGAGRQLGRGGPDGARVSMRDVAVRSTPACRSWLRPRA